MVAPTKLNFKMYQGSTFAEVIRWESPKKVYRSISNIAQSAPCIVTCSSHGVPDGWRAKLTNIVGMKELNSNEVYHVFTNVTSDALEINSVNSVGFSAYVSGGILEYNEPVNLVGFTAKMQLRASADSTEVIDTYTELDNILIDTSTCTVTIKVPAVTTANYSFSSAVYSLELTSPTQEVTLLTVGSISLVKEVTR